MLSVSLTALTWTKEIDVNCGARVCKHDIISSTLSSQALTTIVWDEKEGARKLIVKARHHFLL